LELGGTSAFLLSKSVSFSLINQQLDLLYRKHDDTQHFDLQEKLNNIIMEFVPLMPTLIDSFFFILQFIKKNRFD